LPIDCGDFGTCTSSPPFLNVALILVRIDAGRERHRAREAPAHRSQQYSQPYFGQKKVLRGAWTTRSRLIRATWRNFYKRQRRNVLTGFRPVAL
jgi:formylglycine-generating enzyme required for sulfatase activity